MQKQNSTRNINIGSLSMQRTDRVFIVNDNVFVDGIKLPTPPIQNCKYRNCTIIDDKVYINGYEYKKGKWRRTLKALYYNLFE